MKNLRKEGFTLIELIAVLVIMAILALIVTPLVMNIIRKARVAADRRSIDAYGRSIELAIASYLLDTGKFPTEVSQLTIEYSGDTVSCITEQINPDSSVFLAGCTVKNRTVEGYEYGKDKQPKTYIVGDEVTYNGIDYYVIENSDTTKSTVKLLKAEPLTVAEVNQYGAGHVNRYTQDSVGTAKDNNGYGIIAYYTSENCGYIYDGYDEYGDDVYHWVYDDCKTDYADSEIKYVVDAWAIDKIPSGLQEARLITKEEIDENFEYEEYDYKPCGDACGVVIKRNRISASWMYNNGAYWTSSLSQDYANNILIFTTGEWGDSSPVYMPSSFVRPVIILDKSVLSS